MCVAVGAQTSKVIEDGDDDIEKEHRTAAAAVRVDAGKGVKKVFLLPLTWSTSSSSSRRTKSTLSSFSLGVLLFGHGCYKVSLSVIRL